MKGASIILLILSLALASNRAPFPVGDRAVVIRIDDIQDYGGPSPYGQPEKMVLQYHIDHRIPALLSIIPTRFGEDPQLIDQVKEGLALGIFTVAAHGWHHSPLINLTRTAQATEMQYAKNKLETILGSPVLAFVPPYNEFNRDTIYALKTNGLTLMSSSIYEGDIPREEDGVVFLPQTVTTAVVAQNDTWTELSLESMTNEIKNSWDSYGVAVVVIHPRQFVGADSDSRWLTYLNMLEWIVSNQGRLVQFEPPIPETPRKSPDAFLISVGIFAGLTSTILVAFNISAKRNKRKGPAATAGMPKPTRVTHRGYLSSGFDGLKAFTKTNKYARTDTLFLKRNTGPAIKEPVVEFLYLYCVADGAVTEKFGKIGLGGAGEEVYGIPYGDISAIVSLTRQPSFEPNEENMLAHERVIQEISSRFPIVRLPFSTILEGKKEFEAFLASWYSSFRDRLRKQQETTGPVSSAPSRQPIEEVPAAAARPNMVGGSESRKADQDIQELRCQLERMRKIHSEASQLSNSSE